MTTYFSLLTQTGISKIAAAHIDGTKLNWTHFAVGDSNGVYYDPEDNQPMLQHEVWRGGVNRMYVAPNNANQIIVEAFIPISDGGFDIREAGIFDSDGDLVAVGKYPLTSKPAPGSGAEKDLYVRMVLAVTNAAAVTQEIDPSLVLATKQYVDSRDWRESVRVATTGNVVLSSAPKTVDGITLAVDDRVLVKNQTDQVQNGIYQVLDPGSGNNGVWIRAGLEKDITANMIVPVEEGTQNADTVWMLTTNRPILVGSTPLAFVKIAGNNLSDWTLLSSENGYVKMPNGLIMQWGKTPITASEIQAVVFPLAFPAAVYSVVTGNNFSTLADDICLGVSNITLAQFRVTYIDGPYSAGNAWGAFWMAIGK